MKIKLTIILLLLAGHTVSAQLYISGGAQLYVSGNAEITLQNINFINHGNFTAGNGSVSFTGTVASQIDGTQPISFYNLEMNKPGSSVLLNRNIKVDNQFIFTAGLFNIANFDVDLGGTGLLINEQENSRIYSNGTGRALSKADLNAPASANPGNLGAVISSSQNLGVVNIGRGHQSQTNAYSMGNTVLRYYDINSENNTALNASLRFNYFDAELNSITETNLVLWRSTNNTLWTNEGFTTRDATINFVEKTGIAAFSRWTLSNLGNPLPVLFSGFNVHCNNNEVLLNWKTAQEQNSSHFNIERSNDGLSWAVIGRLPAAGFSSTEKLYSFADNNPGSNNLYRIAQYDIGGRSFNTAVLRAGCSATDGFKVWPNPVTDVVNISTLANSHTPVTIMLYNSSGTLVKKQNNSLLPGNNLIQVFMHDLPAGNYQLKIIDEEQVLNKTIKLIKY